MATKKHTRARTQTRDPVLDTIDRNVRMLTGDKAKTLEEAADLHEHGEPAPLPSRDTLETRLKDVVERLYRIRSICALAVAAAAPIRDDEHDDIDAGDLGEALDAARELIWEVARDLHPDEMLKKHAEVRT